MDDLSLLRRVPLFTDFDDQELLKILQAMQKEKYSPKSVIFWENDLSTKLFVVCSGSVVVSKKLREGVEAVLARFGQGDFFGEMGLLDDSPRSASAQTEEKSELLVMSRESFYQLLREDPRAASKLLLSLLKIFTIRIRDTNERLKDAVVWGLDVAAFEEGSESPP